MSDVEGQTLLYMRDLLTNAAIADPDIATFLPAWVYEEMFHSLALKRFLLALGVDLGRHRLAEVRGKARFREPFERWGSAFVAWLTPGFLAVHMSWGAINERTTLDAYAQLVRRTDNPVLAELLTRIIRHCFGDDEGYQAAVEADEDFALLPGLEGLSLLSESVPAVQKWKPTKNPVVPVPTTVSDVVVSTSAPDAARPRITV